MNNNLAQNLKNITDSVCAFLQQWLRGLLPIKMISVFIVYVVPGWEAYCPTESELPPAWPSLSAPHPRRPRPRCTCWTCFRKYNIIWKILSLCLFIHLCRRRPHALVEPVCCSVIAVGGQEVVVELLEDVQHHSAIRSGHTVVRLLEHVVELIEGKMFAEELMGQPVHFDQSLQLYNSCKWDGQHGVYVPTFTIHDQAENLCKVKKIYAPVMSPASNLEMQRLRDLCRELLILWQINLLSCNKSFCWPCLCL